MSVKGWCECEEGGVSVKGWCECEEGGVSVKRVV